MNKKQLIRQIAGQTGFSARLLKVVVDCIMQSIISELRQGNKISIKDFGSFNRVERQSKSYYNLKSGKMQKMPVKNVVKFTAYKGLKEQLCPNVIELTENDGSLGNQNNLTLEHYIFTNPTQRKLDNNNSRPKTGKQNTGKRKLRKQETSISSLAFEGKFFYDRYQGEGDHNEFPSVKVPLKDTFILLPQTDETGATIGVTEPILLGGLCNMCNELKSLKLLENIKLPILNRNYSYRPDFCLHWEEKNLYIDIEVDEPYDIVSRKPIHYNGNGDNLRDRYFIRNGWCVIRISEQQVHDNIVGVTNYIKRILKWLTDDEHINYNENSLDSIDRWSYEQAEKMAADNTREHYLGLPNYTSVETIDTGVTSNNPAYDSVFVKPEEDILPILELTPKESKWLSIMDEIKHSNCDYCKVTNNNGYQWIYYSKQMKTCSENGEEMITGNSPLGITHSIQLAEIAELVPMEDLFSKTQWEFRSGMQTEDFHKMREILFDAIAHGKPIWVAYNSNNSGYGTRFLSNMVYCWSGVTSDAPHVGLGHGTKYELSSLSHFFAYCSNRKEFRMFAADHRIERLKVLNCNNVYFSPEAYARSFAKLIMGLYDNGNGNAFFENADKILEFMPKNEFESLFVQGNYANLEVLKGNVDNAMELYKQKPYGFFVTPSLTWGEACIADIKYFIGLFKEHLNDTCDYYGFNAQKQMDNYKEVLERLKESSWM